MHVQNFLQSSRTVKNQPIDVTLSGDRNPPERVNRYAKLPLGEQSPAPPNRVQARAF